jgi:hypothetical protein
VIFAHLREVVDNLASVLESEASLLNESLGGVNSDGKLSTALILALGEGLDVLELSTGPGVELNVFSQCKFNEFERKNVIRRCSSWER